MKKAKFTFKAPFLLNIHKRESFDSESLSKYPISLPIMNNINISIDKPVFIISGDNGTGKSTLLEAIAHHCGFNIDGGNRNHIYKDNINESTLLELNQLTKYLEFTWKTKIGSGFFMRAESFINFAKYIDLQAKENGRRLAYYHYGGKSLNEQSHGESFLSLFNNRFGEPGIYILDEPEAALSPEKILSFMNIIHDMEKEGTAQFIISTHSPILMAYPNAQFMYIENGVITKTDYKSSQHYIITKSFLESPERYFKHMFSDEDPE